MRKIVFLGLLLLVAPPAMADLFFADLGTAAPPATLGGYTMTAFGADGRGLVDVTTVASPLGGDVSFDRAMSHRTVPGSWATWSHGYTGDVYWTNGATDVTLTMPSDVGAFYLYGEPNPFDVYQMMATAQDGTTSGWINVSGSSGAHGFGFYGTGGSLITSIQVRSTVDFAVGEFGIAAGAPVPAPGAVLLIGLGLASIGWIKRRLA